VKHDSAPGGATKKTHPVLFQICEHLSSQFGCAKLRQFCQSIVQIILNTHFSTAPKNTTSSGQQTAAPVWPCLREEALPF
jgi:hypothetical protein